MKKARVCSIRRWEEETLGLEGLASRSEVNEVRLAEGPFRGFSAMCFNERSFQCSAI